MSKSVSIFFNEQRPADISTLPLRDALPRCVGQPAGPGSIDVGAITFPKQLDTVARHVDGAREQGARVLVGGRARDGAGDRKSTRLNSSHAISRMPSSA